MITEEKDECEVSDAGRCYWVENVAKRLVHG
jgi:hypothetical protein